MFHSYPAVKHLLIMSVNQIPLKTFQENGARVDIVENDGVVLSSLGLYNPEVGSRYTNHLNTGPVWVFKWWSENQTDKSTFAVQNVHYSAKSHDFTI